MRTYLRQHLRKLVTASITVLGLTGVLVATTGLSLGASTACGCQAPAIAEFEMKNPGGPFSSNPKVGDFKIIEVVNVGKAAGTPAGIPESETQGGLAVGGFFTVTGRNICATSVYAKESGSCSFTVTIAKLREASEGIVTWKATVTVGTGTNSQSLKE